MGIIVVKDKSLLYLRSSARFGISNRCWPRQHCRFISSRLYEPLNIRMSCTYKGGQSLAAFTYARGGDDCREKSHQNDAGVNPAKECLDIHRVLPQIKTSSQPHSLLHIAWFT
jgi:hypothetical protein